MDKDQIQAKLDLLMREVENFQSRRKNLPCVDDCACDASILVGKFMTILQIDEQQAGEGGAESSSSSASASTSVQIQIQAEASPEQKALSNSVVVRIILSWMNPRTLLELRQVSKLWREEATSIILSRHGKYFRVEFTKFDIFENYSNDAGTLPLFLNDCLRHSTVFPCSHFVFNSGRLNHPNLLQFFSKYGRHVEHLGLNPEMVDLPLLRHVLIKWTPHLKSLTFQPTFWAEGQHLVENEGNWLASESQALLLPNLRAITLPKTKSTAEPPGADLIYEILTCASNLTSIEDPHLSYTTQIVAAGKLSLMNTLTWNFKDNDAIFLNFYRFAAAGPQLKSINLFAVSPVKDLAASGAACALFQSSQSTLEIVKNIGYLDDPGYLARPALVSQLPPLPKEMLTKCSKKGPFWTNLIESVEINPEHFQHFRILPRGQSVSEILPNLTSLSFHQSGFWNEQPSPLNAHTLLEKLKISKMSGQFMYESIKPVRSLYPNITQLHIVMSDLGLKDLTEGLREIPRFFQQLQQLFIEIHLNGRLPDQFQIQMDEALTGLPWDVFGRLCNKQEPDEEFQKLEVLDVARNAPSILDLKRLTNLTFEVNFKQRAKPLWSFMAQFYAFQPMLKRQGLEVNVRGFQSIVKNIPLMRCDLGPL